MPSAIKTKEAAARAPKLATLRRYGLTSEDWQAICNRQNGRCPVCGEPFGERALAVDHEHVRGFRARKRRKGKRVVGGRRIDVRVRVMSPSERKAHVRGVLHSFCNRFVRRWLTLDRATRILRYLTEHENRKKEAKP